MNNNAKTRRNLTYKTAPRRSQLPLPVTQAAPGGREPGAADGGGLAAPGCRCPSPLPLPYRSSSQALRCCEGRRTSPTRSQLDGRRFYL